MKKFHGKKLTDRQVRRLALFGFIVCALALLYPYVSDRWNRYVESRLIDNYTAAVEEKSEDEETEKMYEAAEAYNQSFHAVTDLVITEAEYEKEKAYENLLNVTGDGVMGYLEIPCIDVNEAIYHYTDDDILTKGLGHIHGSSLPVGGSGTHAVITGHRGLPSQKMLSDMDKVKKGDRFYIHVLDHVLAYEVDEIETVSPTDVEGLKIEPDKDLVTIVTCTPYGVNTDRLLVTGHRIPFDETQVEAGENVEEHHRYMDPGLAVFYGFMGFIMIVTLITLWNRREKKQNRPHDQI